MLASTLADASNEVRRFWRGWVSDVAGVLSVLSECAGMCGTEPAVDASSVDGAGAAGAA